MIEQLQARTIHWEARASPWIASASKGHVRLHPQTGTVRGARQLKGPVIIAETRLGVTSIHGAPPVVEVGLDREAVSAGGAGA